MVATFLAVLGLQLAVDSLSPSHHFSYALKVNPGQVLSLDQYTDKWLKQKNTTSIALELRHQSLPEDQNPYDRDYNYPELVVGLRYNLNHGTTMHREADPAWGQLQPVDYTSRLGNALTLYGTFHRPLLRTRRWQIAYYLGTGIGYFHHIYNKADDIDNEFIGSHLNIYFTAGLAVTRRLTAQTALQAGIDFSHHSNGALYRPNKGANYLGPFLGIILSPGEEARERRSERTNERAPSLPRLYAELTLGFGGKTLLEDWQKTQFRTDPSDPDYRTTHFRLYPAYSLQADLLYRYARRWASGLGADLFYGTYAHHVRDLDLADGHQQERHSPWSVGIAAKHEVFYGHLSARIGIGVYLYRHMGYNARAVEKPYYERVGLHYSFPRLHNLSLGFSVNAHATKADFTELQISIPIRLK